MLFNSHYCWCFCSLADTFDVAVICNVVILKNIAAFFNALDSKATIIILVVVKMILLNVSHMFIHLFAFLIDLILFLNCAQIYFRDISVWKCMTKLFLTITNYNNKVSVFFYKFLFQKWSFYFKVSYHSFRKFVKISKKHVRVFIRLAKFLIFRCKIFYKMFSFCFALQGVCLKFVELYCYLWSYTLFYCYC